MGKPPNRGYHAILNKNISTYNNNFKSTNESHIKGEGRLEKMMSPRKIKN